MKTAIVWSADALALQEPAVKLIGGKALGLAELKSLGAHVPLWAAVTSEVFKSICETDPQLRGLLQTQSPNVLEKAYAVRKYISRMPIDSEYVSSMLEVWQAISAQGSHPVSVRSSATFQDSAVLSFAGMMDTFLNIRSEKAFLEAVRGCWLSLFGDRVVLYSVSNAIDPWSASVAVVVQQMVRSQVSGVLWSVNTMTGNRKEMLVTSTWGLGEGLSSGLSEADNFTVDGHGKVINREVAIKRQLVDAGENGATTYDEVQADKQAVASLSDEQILMLHKLASKVHAFKKMPVDIEFAFEGDTLYLLQARPITGLKGEGAGQDNLKVWENARLLESFAGVTTPLTFSFFKRIAYAYYWQFYDSLWIDGQTIRSQSYLFEQMFGLLEGRVYCNLVNLRKMIALIPWFSLKRAIIESSPGLETVVVYNPAGAPESPFEQYVIPVLRFLRTAGKMLLCHVLLADMNHEFRSRFNKIHSRYAGLDFDLKTPAQLLEIYREIENEIFWKQEAFVFNDIEAMFLYWILRRLNRTWGIDKDATLHNELLRATGTMVTSEMLSGFYRIASMIHRDAELEALFLKRTPQQALHLINDDSRFAAVNQELLRFQEEYGAYTFGAMKLESRLQEDHPLFCVHILQEYLRKSVHDPVESQIKEVSVLLKAQKELKEALARKAGLMFMPRHFFYQWVLKNARVALKNKENHHFLIAKAVSLIRSLMKALGRQWCHKGIIESEQDVCYLEIGEIQSYLQGASTCLSLKSLIALRKKEFGAFESLNPGGFFETRGEPYYQNVFTREEKIYPVSVLNGTGCCRGVVEGKVQVVSMADPHGALTGDIIAAAYLDPAWVALFPALKGLIVEKADMLSHAAIVARELGLPMVVGVKHATKLLHTGDEIMLNATQGSIKILKKFIFD